MCETKISMSFALSTLRTFSQVSYRLPSVRKFWIRCNWRVRCGKFEIADFKGLQIREVCSSIGNLMVFVLPIKSKFWKGKSLGHKTTQIRHGIGVTGNCGFFRISKSTTIIFCYNTINIWHVSKNHEDLWQMHFISNGF